MASGNNFNLDDARFAQNAELDQYQLVVSVSTGTGNWFFEAAMIVRLVSGAMEHRQQRPPSGSRARWALWLKSYSFARSGPGDIIYRSLKARIELLVVIGCAFAHSDPQWKRLL